MPGIDEQSLAALSDDKATLQARVDAIRSCLRDNRRYLKSQEAPDNKPDFPNLYKYLKDCLGSLQDALDKVLIMVGMDESFLAEYKQSLKSIEKDYDLLTALLGQKLTARLVIYTPTIKYQHDADSLDDVMVASRNSTRSYFAGEYELDDQFLESTGTSCTETSPHLHARSDCSLGNSSTTSMPTSTDELLSLQSSTVKPELLL